MFACALELWSISNISDEAYNSIQWFLSPVANALWNPSNLVAAATNVLIAGFRFGAVAFPITVKVNLLSKRQVNQYPKLNFRS
jgi:hypothetical protein